MNFTYKNPNLFDKKYAILKHLEVEEKIKKSNEKAIQYSLAKKEFNKIQDVERTFMESKEPRGPENEKDLYDIKNITNSTSIQVQNVESIMVESIPVRGADNEKDLYDINNVNQQISNKLTIDFVDSTNVKKLHIYDDEIIVPYNVDRIRTKGVKIIYNVYQTKYSNGAINGTGFGDFIRGSYFLLEFCEKYKFEPRFLFNNCISKFLLHNKNSVKIQPILANIDMFHNNNFKAYNIQDDYIFEPRLDLAHIMADFIDYIMTCPVYNGNTFIYCIPYPIQEVSEKSKQYMRTILEPIDEIKNNLYHALQEVGLNIKRYSVFHIRSGDKYLNKDDKIFFHKYLDKLIKEMECILLQENAPKYLIIADNNEIKILLQKHFPQVKIILNEITHFGEGVWLEEEKVKNTLIDFYLLSFANSIISFSAYEHGSGFSYWCAKTFNVPYISRYISS
jgi:hypothetical protein